MTDTTKDGVRSDLLAVHLNDHLAIAVGGLELARRARGAHEGTPFGEHASRLVRELEAQRDALERAMGDLGVARDRAKVAGAWAGEKLGRLKLNGHLLASSPLSPVVEAEGLLAAFGAQELLWRGIEALGPALGLSADIDAGGLATRASGCVAELRERRLELLRSAVLA